MLVLDVCVCLKNTLDFLYALRRFKINLLELLEKHFACMLYFHRVDYAKSKHINETRKQKLFWI